MRHHAATTLLVRIPCVLKPARFVFAVGVMVSPMHDPAFLIPLKHAVELNTISRL